MMKLKVKKLDPRAKLPTYANPNDAGLDLYALEAVTIAPGRIGRVRTGIAMEIPDGYVGLCWDKSGLSHKHGLKVMGGVVDAGYRGELVVALANHGPESYTFEIGHKVMQLLIQQVETVEIAEVKTLSDSTRGSRALGSSGK